MELLSLAVVAAAFAGFVLAEDCPAVKETTATPAVADSVKAAKPHHALRHGHPRMNRAARAKEAPAAKAPAAKAPAAADLIGKKASTETTQAKPKAAAVQDTSKPALPKIQDSHGLTSISGGPENAQPNGVPGFPLTSVPNSAKEPNDPVPEGALIYEPKGTIFDCGAFNNWTTEIRNDAKNHATKFMKIKPGTYIYKVGVYSDAAKADSNLDNSRNIQFFAWESGWTLDMRGVIFSVPRPEGPTFDIHTGTAFYVNQAPNFRILGGTIWFDQGELYSYATITSLKPSPDNDDVHIGTMSIVKGYNISVWRDDQVNARNVASYAASQWPRHLHPDNKTNLWYMSNWKLNEEARTATAEFSSRAQVKVGELFTRVAGQNMPTTIDSEVEGGLRVYGMTTNGGFTQIGDNNNGGATATYIDCRLVNPPPRPGYGPRYLGPALQWGNNFPVFNGPYTPPIEFSGSKWQQYGGDEDIVPLVSQGMKRIPSPNPDR